MRLRLERRIAYLQNILNVRYPVEIVSTVQVSPIVEPPTEEISSTPITIEPVSIEQPLGTESRLCREIEQLDDGMTDMNDDEIQQRDEEARKLQDALTQLELDKLLKRKPRVKK